MKLLFNLFFAISCLLDGKAELSSFSGFSFLLMVCRLSYCLLSKNCELLIALIFGFFLSKNTSLNLSNNERFHLLCDAAFSNQLLFHFVFLLVIYFRTSSDFLNMPLFVFVRLSCWFFFTSLKLGLETESIAL